MNKGFSRGFRVFAVIYLLVVHALAGLFLYQRFVAPHVAVDESFAANVAGPAAASPVPTIIPVPDEEPLATPPDAPLAEPSATPAANANLPAAPVAPSTILPPPGAPAATPPAATPAAPSNGLMIPVRGIKRSQLVDTFTAARSENRTHDAIDIIAPGGTPVVAAVDGEIAKFFDSKPGGITIYQYDADKKYVYYYAHLASRAAGLKEKDYVTQGTVIGYVGDTGNAGPGNFHLHFSIALLADPKRYWEGQYVNPFPLLREALEAR